MNIVIAVILVFLVVAGWSVFWHLVRHPDSPFFLEGQGFQMHFGLRLNLDRIMVLFNITEHITQEDVTHLLGVTKEEADKYLKLLIDTDQVELFVREDDTFVYKRI